MSQNYLKQSLEQIISDRFGKYSKYIIQDRAIPDARDGLKPVQRRILYAMNELGLTFDKPYKKAARIVGEVIGKYHPHGDSSIYDALVRMSQTWKSRFPLIEMHGNNGSMDNDPPAAMRYTEARLTKLANLMLVGINQNVVKWTSNFDDSEIEPTVLPNKIPNLLINGSKGIAAGYATEMPPHNLVEILNAAITMIKKPSIKLVELVKIVQGPDFPTAGIVQGLDDIFKAFEHGQGRIVIKAKATIVKQGNKKQIIIQEIPYGVVKSKLIRQIDEIKYQKTIHGIKEVRDESDRKQIKIVIDLQINVKAQLILDYLFAKTELQIYYNYNNIAIVNKSPKLLSLAKLLTIFINHQKTISRQQLKFQLNKNVIRLEILMGLIKAIKQIDQVIEVIKSTIGNKQKVIDNLETKLSFSKIQANAIAELRLYRLSSTDLKSCYQEKDNLKLVISKQKNLLDNSGDFDNYLIAKLEAIKQEFNQPRLTKIEANITKVTIDQEKLFKHKDVFLGISKFGYLKVLTSKFNNLNKLAKYHLRDQDSLVFLDKINTNHKLLIFTENGKYILLKTHKLLETKLSALGKHINDFANLGSNFKIVAVIALENFNQNAFIVLTTKTAKVKRIRLKDFATTRDGKLATTIKLKVDDYLLGAKLSTGSQYLILFSSNGKAVKYHETMIPTRTKKASGIVGMSLDDNLVLGFVVANETDQVLWISNHNFVKKISVEQILISSRLTKGKYYYKVIKSRDFVINDINVVESQTQIILKQATNDLQFLEAKTIKLSSIDKKPSKLVSCISWAKIANFAILDQNWKQTKLVKLTEKQQFELAENKVKQVKTFSIKDILDDL